MLFKESEGVIVIDIEMLVDDFRARLKERGVLTTVTYCISEGNIVGFEIKITGYTD